MDMCRSGASIDPQLIDRATGTVDEVRLETLLVEIARLAREFARSNNVKARHVDDLVQDVVLECLVSIREGQWNGDEAPLPKIVGRIVRCRAVDALRHRQRTAAREADFSREVNETSHAWMAPDAVAEERELQALHEKALAALPPACRRAYVMVREEGFSYAQAATILGVSRSGVSAFVVKAQRKLRGQLKRRGIEATVWRRRRLRPDEDESIHRL
jgi:RNA polymerase sigma-70 factor (ECF subfamily)